MSAGISWEQLHDQISELLPLLDPPVAQIARQALARGRVVRAAHGAADHGLDAVLDQVDGMLTILSRATPESHVLTAVQYLLLGLLPVAVLTTHLIAAWPSVQAARRALQAQPVPPGTGSRWEAGEGYRPHELTWPPNNRHEAGALAVATRQL
jgi:hypothetical protein